MYLDVALLIIVYTTLVYLIAQSKKDNSVAITFWGIGLVLVSWYCYMVGVITPVSALVLAMVNIWGFRLSSHLLVRKWGRAEDFRYQKLRDSWKNYQMLRGYFAVFIPFAVLLYLMSLPIVFVFSQPLEWSYIATASALIWTIGFLVETVADYQLVNHKRRPTKKLLTTGLWQYSRHPNQFGEAMLWWGIGIAALPFGWWVLIGPVIYTCMIRYVSGVVPVESRIQKKKGYADYAKNTALFIPWFPKN